MGPRDGPARRLPSRSNSEPVAYSKGEAPPTIPTRFDDPAGPETAEAAERHRDGRAGS
ncbi:hypothetical protein HNQ79_000009 [Streptomyces candidus]|uniref:Uncharacterized protein n=1 Tax=Streptomyces candidus TaxID=67283 RepID=A0A7X0H9V0_9ACTN|nr:hypothetical protein [Streptomyces candidus]